MKELNFSQITKDIFIGRTPRTEAYPLLRELGVELVINMRVERRPHPDLHDPPMPVLWLPSFDSPFIPIPLRFLLRGARTALEVIEDGGKVYVHCAGGVHRGVAMGAAILIAQGNTLAESFRVIKEKRIVADPDIWYIKRQIERFANLWAAQWEAGQGLSRGEQPQA